VTAPKGDRLLLDTHIVLWWLTDSDELTDAVKSAIDNEPEVYLSAASVWEVAIKQQIGKLRSDRNLGATLEQCDLQPLPISLRHVRAVGELPLIHRDPFDRILLAQARTEGLTLLTRDPIVASYGGAVIVV
jgi:PIN domain nuclease of toxin-antitoxin system